MSRVRGEGEQGEREGDLERRGGGQAGAARDRAGDIEPSRREDDAGARELGDGAADERAPAVRRLRVLERERVALAQVARARVDRRCPRSAAP